MAVGYLTSSTLISTVKREAMVPTSQSTFTDADFLAMANQEMRIGLVPSILQFHEEYYTRDSAPVPLVAYQSRYEIPYRAVGGKFRAVFYLNTNNSLRSMTRIQPEDRPYYQQSSSQNDVVYFYIQGNQVVLVPEVSGDPVGSLVYTFYMRPNELVDESRVATISNISYTDQKGTVTAIGIGTTPTITSIGHGLSTGNIIGITGSNSTPTIDGNQTITVVHVDNFTITTAVTVIGSQANWTYVTTTYTVDQIPSGFSLTTPFDLLQTNPGHKTINFDVTPLVLDSVNNLLIFNTADVRTSALSPNIGTMPIVGDYIAFAGECIIPQAPSDVHDVLSQRVVLRCLQALGDAAGYATAQGKLAEMEKYSGMLLDNRSEGEPQKIFNRRGLLVASRLRTRGWL